MNKKLNKEDLSDYIRWIGSLFGAWWLPICLTLVVVLVLGLTKSIWLALLGGSIVFVYAKANGGSEALIRAKNVFKTKLSEWWNKRPS